jgi:hypothetical protein
MGACGAMLLAAPGLQAGSSFTIALGANDGT